MGFLSLPRLQKLFLVQKVMLQVSGSLCALVLASIYLFGWRSLAVLLVVLFFGVAAEALFTWRDGKPVTSAVLVTCLIFSLSLPPSIPFWMAAIGIVAGVTLGKMVFGGFGRNVFNPAMVGRCFIYINFPLEMTNRWVAPLWGGAGGFDAWSAPADAVSRATPLAELRQGIPFPIQDLLLGNTSGCLGETSALLILLCGAYLFYTKAASWRLALSCVAGGIVLSSLLRGFGLHAIPSPSATLLSGSFLFGAVFVVTEPVSGPKRALGQWIYGFLIGGLTVLLRGFSNFSEGIMFSVLLLNALVPLLERGIRLASPGKGT